MIDFINNIGYVIKNVESKKKVEVVNSNGEELINIVQFLCKCAKIKNINTKLLWVEKIPRFILVTEFVKNYNNKKKICA